MIVTCQEGNVFRVHGDGTSTHLAGPFGTEIEGPAVVPPGFGPHGGEIWVAAEDSDAIHALRNNNDGTYTVFPSILSHVNPEGVFVIPSPPCTFCTTYAFFQTEQQQNQLIWAYPLSDFNMLGGNVIITSESGIQGADTDLVTVSGGNYVQTSFGSRPPGVNEGANFVECDVPTATPTATFTPTPTATATFTPTPTATFTPTPTPTPPGVACQQPTSISGNFNNFTIAMGNYIWFTSVLKANHLPALTPVTVTFTNQTITSANFGPLSVPDATVTFDPAAVTATTNFIGGTWVTTVPSSIGGNRFLSGLNFLVPVNLPGSIKNVTWSGTISVDTPGVSINWQWAAANYPTFSANPALLGVKPVDDNKASQYKNSDHAGTPENFKQFVVGSGTGGGGSNYTGSHSSTGSVCR